MTYNIDNKGTAILGVGFGRLAGVGKVLGYGLYISMAFWCISIVGLGGEGYISRMRTWD
jgi:hypothetical protein